MNLFRNQFIEDVLSIAIDRLRTQIRVPVWVAMEFIEPIMWLIMYSQLYTKEITTSFLGNRSYLDYFVPGLLLMTCFFAASWSGMGLLDRLRSGFINRVLVTPISRWAIILGYALALTITLWIQMVIVLLTAFLLGWRPELTFHLLFFLFIAVTMVGIAFSALSFALTFVGQREEAIIPVLNFLILPLIFLSGIFIPLSYSPKWIQIAAKFNPLAWTHKFATLPLPQAYGYLFPIVLFTLFALWISRRTVKPYL
ncbi:MAG: ABC transporter permease [bacterium]|nr:ABC transporter permease [bacterium]